MEGLNGFLERDQDRALFDLPANTKTAAAGADPLPGWRPHRLTTGDWGSRYLGDTATLPSELVGTPITVQAKNGQRWTGHRHGGPGPEPRPGPRHRLRATREAVSHPKGRGRARHGPPDAPGGRTGRP